MPITSADPSTVVGSIDGEIMIHDYNLYVWNSVAWKILPLIKFQSAPPANPSVGQMYYNTAGNSLNIWNGTTWKSATFN